MENKKDHLKLQPWSAKFVNPETEVFKVTDVKETINQYIKDLWENLDNIADEKCMTFDYDLIKDLAKKRFGDLVK
jgi:DNA-directed RNA polymerase alpha subunit